MSYTEIFKINKAGDIKGYADIRNAHRGAMAVWHRLDKKYLPPYVPEYAKIFGSPGEEYSRAFALSSENAIQEIWDLQNNPEISLTDLIALYSTFDKMIVLKADFPQLLRAFREFDSECSLPEQADVIEALMSDNDCIGVAWNQTSVCCDTWRNYIEEKEEYAPYNIFKQSDHFDLFSIIKGKPQYDKSF